MIWEVLGLQEDEEISPDSTALPLRLVTRLVSEPWVSLVLLLGVGFEDIFPLLVTLLGASSRMQ